MQNFGYWNKEVETLPPRDLRRLQERKLQDTILNAYHHNEFYRNLYRNAGVFPSDITCLEDLAKLPFTNKERVRSAFPFGLKLKSPHPHVEMHCTSGTTGKPVPVFATRNDIRRWAELNARSLWMVGLRPGDILQNAYGYGFPTGGFGFHYGGMELGAMVIPIGAGQIDRQIDTILDFGVAAICMTPSYAIYLSERAHELGIDFRESGRLRLGLFGAEPWPEATRQRIETSLGITAYDEFGMTEMLGPGMSCECPVRDGMHVWADAFIVECIVPNSEEPVPEGKEGELVWTWLGSEGTAIIRYRSGDLASIIKDDCPCGRTHPKISRIKGRCDDAFSVNGFVVFPSQVEDVLIGKPGVGSNFKILLNKDSRGLDSMTVSVEVLPVTGITPDKLRENLSRSLKAVTGITCSIDLVAPGSLSRSVQGEGKTASNRVEDLRWKT